MKKSMTMKEWEKSKMDAKADKAGAKKAGVSRKKYEASKADEAADRKGLKRYNSQVLGKR